MMTMKLTKIKLINWHIFSNHTINVDGNMLITGENGCGKSTLMDAIYYVLSGGDHKQFNKAANESGERSLETYLKGKIGTDKVPYLRMNSNVIGYVVLQFTNIKNTSVSVGCSLEIADNSPVKSYFFVLDNYEICDDDFIIEKKVVDHKVFKTRIEFKKYIYTKMPDVLRDRKRMLGRDIFKISNYSRFFELLQNAISFKPISEVSSFVNGFLLKDDPIKLDTLKQEIRSYQDINRLLMKEEDKLKLLNQFVPKTEKYLNNLLKLQHLELIKVKSERNRLILNKNRKEIEFQRNKDDYSLLEPKKKDLASEIINFQVNIKQYEDDEEYKALQNKIERLNKINDKLNKDIEIKNSYEDIIKEEISLVRQLHLNYRLDEDLKNEDYTLLKIHGENLHQELEDLKKEKNTTWGKFQFELNNESHNLVNLKKEVEDLKNGIENYPNDVKLLIDIANNAIKRDFPKDKDVFVRPLCEYLEVRDELWTNALEGYLNTQKFNLIVEPKYYDCVANEYEKLKDSRRIYGAGVVNYKGLPNTKEVENSLFSKLDIIKNKYAEKYAFSILSNVVCCENAEQCKKYDAAITPKVMIYKKGVLHAARPETYNKPYLGKSSKEKRLALLNNDIQVSFQNIKNLKFQISQIEEVISLIEKSKSSEINKMQNIWQEINNDTSLYEELEKEILNDQKTAGLLSIETKIKETKKNLSLAEQELIEIENKMKALLEKKGSLQAECYFIKNNLQVIEIKFKDLYDKIDDKEEFLKIEKAYLEKKSYNDAKINEDYFSAQSSNNANKDFIIKSMDEYVRMYRPSFTKGIENAKDYIYEYNQIRNRGVVEFKEQAKLAYERAEKSFREDFIAKLNANIEEAVSTLKRINKNLANHPFGTENEKYEFTYKPTGVDEFANYYRIITSGKLLESKDLFTDILSEADSVIMKELFDKISMETNSNETERELQKYLDYRNYMSYDIKITNKSDEITFFSKINKEKSGGETQTPFYIVMASCFDELLDRERNSTAVVVFDEAFNNMDEGRTKALMEFYNNLNIQIVIVVPSLRMHTISHYMDTVIGIVKQNNYPHVITMGERIR